MDERPRRIKYAPRGLWLALLLFIGGVGYILVRSVQEASKPIVEGSKCDKTAECPKGLVCARAGGLDKFCSKPAPRPE